MNVEDKAFDDSYQSTLDKLQIAQQDPNFDIATAKAELESLYLYEVLDWTGRGEIKNSDISGAIAGYQVFIHNYTKQNQK